MVLFVIGDIHGCHYTFIEMLKHWSRKEEYLISVGDLIDRGKNSALVVKECIKILSDHSNSTFLKGNHEAEFTDYFDLGKNDNWTDQGGDKTIMNFTLNNINLKTTVEFFNLMPLKFENENLLITHAGISDTTDPFEERNRKSVLWNRGELKNIGKLQIHGHVPLKNVKPLYNTKSNSWNIDTGAAYGFGLTGLKISSEGKVIEIIHTETDERDI